MLRLLLAFLLLTTTAQAADVTLPTTYANGGTVTATNLNGNFTAITAQVNGGLDNDNANGASGYRFFETKAALPSNGSQGRTVFLTTDNSLNLDTGAAWVKTITPSGTPATGYLPYYNSGWVMLAPGAQYYSLVSNGVSSLPSYQQVSLTNGVTSTLPIANGGTGQTTAQAAIDALLPSQASANGKYLTSNGSASSWGTAPTFASIAGAYTAGDYPLSFNAWGDIGSSTTTGSTTYVKVAELYLPRGGTLRVKFWLRTSNAATTGYGRIYQNGSAIGTEHTTVNTSGEQFSEDISGWSAGDLLQLYIHDTGGVQTASGGGIRLFSGNPIIEIANYSTYPRPFAYFGNGSPFNNVGSIGDTYVDLAGSTSTTLYVKTASTTWTAK